MWLLRAWLDQKLEPSRRFQQILFSCTACRNCVEQCALPKIKDELLLALTAGKEELIDEGKVPPAVRDCLTKFQNYGNPYGLSRKKRTHWAAGAGVELFSGQDYLFFPGDVGAFDDRGKEIARSVATLLMRLGISFGIMGEKEVSDGNDVSAMGESELFRLLAEENIKHFDQLNVKKIIALSPHGFNALKNEYPALGGLTRCFITPGFWQPIVAAFALRTSLPSFGSPITIRVIWVATTGSTVTQERYWQLCRVWSSGKWTDPCRMRCAAAGAAATCSPISSATGRNRPPGTA